MDQATMEGGGEIIIQVEAAEEVADSTIMAWTGDKMTAMISTAGMVLHTMNKVIIKGDTMTTDHVPIRDKTVMVFGLTDGAIVTATINRTFVDLHKMKGMNRIANGQPRNMKSLPTGTSQMQQKGQTPTNLIRVKVSSSRWQSYCLIITTSIASWIKHS
jgi:hypothetical protein